MERDTLFKLTIMMLTFQSPLYHVSFPQRLGGLMRAFFPRWITPGGGLWKCTYALESSQVKNLQVKVDMHSFPSLVLRSESIYIRICCVGLL
jgi:hypothetical protein